MEASGRVILDYQENPTRDLWHYRKMLFLKSRLYDTNECKETKEILVEKERERKITHLYEHNIVFKSKLLI